MGGVRIRLRFPFIRDLDSIGTFAINQALLIMKNEGTDTAAYPPPPELSLYRTDSAGRLGYIIDDKEGAAYFDGAYDEGSNGYLFRLSRHIQQLLINDTLTNYDLTMYASDPLENTFSIRRVVLDGTSPYQSSDYQDKMRLKIIYTKLR
jgi:hypothetical protein